MVDTGWTKEFEPGMLTIGVNGADSGYITGSIDLSQGYSSIGQNWRITTTDTTSPVYIYDKPDGNLKVNGGAEINGPLTVDGVDIGQAVRRIEERLAILRPNEGLEERWNKLKELGDQYRRLEEELLQQEKIVSILGK